MKKTVYARDCKRQFHPTFTNSKLGGKKLKMMAVSYVPGYDYIIMKNGNFVSDCQGTCGTVDCSQCERACYAVRSYKQYPTVTKNRVENTLQLREEIEQHFADIYWTIKDNNINVVRYTESGEIENINQFMHLYWLSMDLPTVKFYLYTKNYNVLREFFNNHILPNNLVVLISVWGENGAAAWQEFKKYSNVKCFAVNSDLKVSCYCPAYRKDENGKVYRVTDDRVKCGNCRLCFDSTAKIIGCYEH